LDIRDQPDEHLCSSGVRAIVNEVARLAEEQSSLGPAQPGQRLDRTRCVLSCEGRNITIPPDRDRRGAAVTAETQGNVRLAWASIQPTAEWTGRAHVRFRPRAPWPEGSDTRTLLETVDRARLLANDLSQEPLEVYAVSPTPEGLLLVVEDGDPDEKRVWLGDVAADLAAVG
jgi:hypothetical protein